MKTAMYLLMLTEGNPLLSVDQLADLLHLGKRTIQNKHYGRDFAIPLFKMDGGELFAHVSDVAAYIDAQRAAATALLQDTLKAA